MTKIYYEGKLYSEAEFDRLTFKPIDKPAKPKKAKSDKEIPLEQPIDEDWFKD